MNTKSDLYFELDFEIRRITGNSPYLETGLRSTSHLSKVAQRRVQTLRERKTALKEI